MKFIWNYRNNDFIKEAGFLRSLEKYAKNVVIFQLEKPGKTFLVC